MDLRAPEAADIPALAQLWHRAWMDAHADIVPAALVANRSAQSLAERLPGMLEETRMAGPTGQPLGFCTLSGDELEQLFLAPEARGTGLARQLLDDGEARLAGRGTQRAWLACAEDNARAAAFYRREGWDAVRIETHPAPLPRGTIDVRIIRFEKDLSVREAAE